MSGVLEKTSSQCLCLPDEGETVYLIGAGGCGMSALGHILIDLKRRVVGSDIQSNKNIEQLVHRGARIFIGHKPENILNEKPALVVFTSAICEDNPELVAARRMGNIPVLRRGEFLARVVNRTRLVCVAGMHGKTTTSALLAYGFENLGRSAGYAVGWNVPQLERNGRFNLTSINSQSQISGGGFFTIEADESDGTILYFKPEHSVVLNIDREHLDYFGTFESLQKEFSTFINNTREFVVYCADDPVLKNIVGQRKMSYSYGFSENADFRIKLIGEKPDRKGYFFEVIKNGKSLGRFSNSLPGSHNVLNSAASIALFDLLGFELEKVSRIINSFRGAERRQEELFNNEKIRVFDDYGHHPNEIRATINAIKPFSSNRLFIVFQPHRYTRTRDLYIEFGRCFAGAVKVFVMDIYSAGEKPIPGVSSQLIVNEILKNGLDAEYVRDPDEVCQLLLKEVSDGDVVLFCGAGADVTLSAHKFASLLIEKEKHSSPLSDYGKKYERPKTMLIV